MEGNVTHSSSDDLESISDEKTRIHGWDRNVTSKVDIKIGTGITAVDLPDDTTVLLRACNATLLLGENAATLFSTIHIRENSI